MPKTTSYAGSLLSLIFKNTTYATVGDATGIVGSTAPGSLFFSLHTADPTVTGTQTSNEATYTGYVRVTVARSAGGFTVTANSVSPVAAVTFPACSAGANTITFFGIGSASTGVGILLYSGSVSPSISVAPGVTPSLSTSSAITEA